MIKIERIETVENFEVLVNKQCAKFTYCANCPMKVLCDNHGTVTGREHIIKFLEK